MQSVVIIPARGGSKRLPRKNITPVLGLPLIAWSIKAAQNSAFVGPDNVYVSTEDAEVAEVARQYGAQVIARPSELAQDNIWTEPVIQHGVETIEAGGKKVDVVVWLNACGAQLTRYDIDYAIQRLQNENLREIFSVDGKMRSNSIVRAMRRDTLFQHRLSVHCAVMVLDYVDIHYADDVAIVEGYLRKRDGTGENAAPLSPKSGVLDDRNWSNKAWMSPTDANLLECIIRRGSERATDRFDVLEWGTGRSTLYFTEMLKQLGVKSNWVSLEYDREYFDSQIKPQVEGREGTHITLIDKDGDAGLPDENASLNPVVFNKGKLLPFLQDHAADRQEDLDDYVSYPSRLGKKFDLIIVDGRKRRRCLIEAAGLLKPYGVAFLHDAYRTYYQCAFPYFRSQRMLGEILWIGAQYETNFLEWIV